MRRLILSTNVTLDGYTAGPNGELDWLLSFATSEAGAAYLRRFMETVDTVLLGRKNYEGFFGYWPSVAEDPDASPSDRSFSRWLNGVEKIVFSTTLDAAEWENTRVAASVETEELMTLKERRGGDLLVMNSTTVAQALIARGLIDEFRLNIFPILLGSGQRLFAGDYSRSALQLVRAEPSAFGVVECMYELADSSA